MTINVEKLLQMRSGKMVINVADVQIQNTSNLRSIIQENELNVDIRKVLLVEHYFIK